MQAIKSVASFPGLLQVFQRIPEPCALSLVFKHVPSRIEHSARHAFGSSAAHAHGPTFEGRQEEAQSLVHREVPAVMRTCMQISASAALDIQHSTALQMALQSAQLHGSEGSLWNLAHTQENGLPVLKITEHESSPDGCSLTAVVPDKWVSLELSTQGQNIAVSRITEADVTCLSNGGDVSLGTIKTGKTYVNTVGPKRCGSLTGSDLSASDLTLESGSGPINVRRMLGLQCRVLTHGSPVSIKAAYGESVEVSTGGGDIQVSNLSCSKGARLESGGGNIAVDSLDSDANLSSKGGSIKVHLQENVGMVEIQSEGGNVEVAVTPQSHVKVVVQGASEISCAGTDVTAIQGEDTVLDVQPTTKASPTRGTNTKCPPGATSTVRVGAGGGRLIVKQMGWMDMVKQKMET